MQIVSVPAEAMVDPALNLTSIVERHASDTSNPVLYRWQMSPGNWQDIHAHQFHDMVVSIAKGLIAHGVKPGDRIGIMSRTRFEWALIDFAIWYAGAISVPIYETNAPAQVAWALSHSEAQAIFVENDKLVQITDKAHKFHPLNIKNRWVIENGDLDTLITAGLDVSDTELEAARTHAHADSLATIVYTSGTTGKPKGCALTHGNFLNLSLNTRIAEPEIANPRSSSLIFLPLAHVLARFIQVLALDSGVVVGHSPTIKNLAADLDSFKPTMLLVVPRVFEKIYEGALAKAARGGTINKNLFKRAVKVAIAWSEAKVSGRLPLKLAAQYALYDKLVYTKLRAAMGGKLRYAVCGGGPLSPRLNHFYHAVGVRVVEGYGLTETCAPIAAGRISNFQIGAIGPLLPGSQGRLAEDGELELRGIGVMKEYYKNPAENAQSFTDDGWFKSGDLARFDDQGLLKIVGRKKEIIVTAGGKNVIPGTAENHLRTSPLVSQAMLVGDQKPFIAALVTLDTDTLPDQLEHLGLPRSLSIPEAAVHPAVRAAIQRIIDEANQLVSRAEAIREFRIMGKDLTEADGYLTPSQKLKRAKILQDFSAYVDDIYSRVSESANNKLERLQSYAEQASDRLQEFKTEKTEKLHDLKVEATERLEEFKGQAAEKLSQYQPVRATPSDEERTYPDGKEHVRGDLENNKKLHESLRKNRSS